MDAPKGNGSRNGNGRRLVDYVVATVLRNPVGALVLVLLLAWAGVDVRGLLGTRAEGGQPRILALERALAAQVEWQRQMEQNLNNIHRQLERVNEKLDDLRGW